MSKRPRQWPPLPGPVPDKRLAVAAKYLEDKPVARARDDDGWITVGWLDEISTAGSAIWSMNTAMNTATTATQSFAELMRMAVPATGAPLTSEKEREYLDRIGALVREKVSAERLVDDQAGQITFLRSEVVRMRTKVEELRSWLTGVAEVEDPEIPGLYLCGICHRPLGPHREHREGCPMIPGPGQ